MASKMKHPSKKSTYMKVGKAKVAKGNVVKTKGAKTK